MDFRRWYLKALQHCRVLNLRVVRHLGFSCCSI